MDNKDITLQFVGSNKFDSVENIKMNSENKFKVYF